MSHNFSTTPSSSKFQLIINDALNLYHKRTKNDLLLHPLATELQNCDSPADILAVLQRQIQGLNQSRSGDDRWTKWLDPTINVLLTFSQAAGTVGLAFSPATVVFAGIGVLLSAAKDIQSSQETLLDIFERIRMFFRRLEMYTEVPLTTEMTDLIIETMAEVLSVLGIATKEIKQSRTKKYMKRLIGRTDMEDALRRLDKLTQEEARMAAAENLRATHAVDERVRGVANIALDIDNSVARVDDRVAGINDQVTRVDDRVAGVDDTVKGIDTRVASVADGLKVVDNKVDEVIHGGKEASTIMQQAANDLDQIKQNELRRNIHKWLSPPDPSTNHNIACDTGHKTIATWFFQGRIYQEWKSKGSLLWIHGKPGSGKSVLCSTVIEDIKAMCKAGNASMAYFYFDFRDAKKQGMQDLVRSLLSQLSARLASRCDILSKLYSDHDEGKDQPSNRDSIECLKGMLSLPDQQRPTYLIVDALDECPNTPGIPSPRQKVLHFVKELVDLCLPNLHICVTSRPEIDVRNVLEPLTSRRVSLHDQSGQKEDIADYVRSVVYSDSEQIMGWRTEDKEHVIKTLSERADGMFRWVFCQLEILRDCLPPSVRRILNELPESLDETYDRVLKEIKKSNRDHARRLLSSLVAAVRPLRVEELAEVLAVDYEDEEGIPKLNPNWRWEDQEQALLTSCSSLIAIVESGDSRVVQFSHFSVKEYLTSARLATSSQDISRYHIVLEPAHTILAQTCLSILLRMDSPIEDSGVKGSPLSGYAAENWVRRAQFGDVVSSIKGMESLFDPDKPYFAAWRELHDIDTQPRFESTFYQFEDSPRSNSDVVPLYYAALCGFQDLAEHLILKYPHHVNTSGGRFVTPLIAALAGEHFQTAKILRDNGAHPNVKGFDNRTPLHSAAQMGHHQMVRLLLEYKADPNARNFYDETPLYFLLHTFMSADDSRSDSNLSQLHIISRILLEHGADVNARCDDLGTPLHNAAQNGRVEVVRVLLEHGASVGAEDKYGKTPLQLASSKGHSDVIKLLSEHGAK